MRCFDLVLSWFVVAFVVALLDAGEDAFAAPFTDVAFGSGLGDVETGGQLLERLCCERRRQRGQELFAAFGAFCSGLGELGTGEFLVDADGVADEDAGDSHG